MASDIIGAGITAQRTDTPRPFLASDESLNRGTHSPEIPALQLNPLAPASSLLAVAMARVQRCQGVVEVVTESGLDVGPRGALEAVTSMLDELGIVLMELQHRDNETCKAGRPQ